MEHLVRILLLVLLTLSFTYGGKEEEEKQQKQQQQQQQQQHDHVTQMKIIMDGITRILSRLEEQQIRLHNLEEQLLSCKTCASETNLEEFQNMSLIEFQRTEVSLRDCSKTDQISELQTLMEKDECRDGTHQCHEYATCTDRLINYHCTCQPGFSGDGFWCQDINECISQNVSCWENEICANRPGSFECICNEGFVRRGGNCIDTRCESPSLFIDDVGCITPILTQMTWDEARRACKGLGLKLLEDISFDHITIIGPHFRQIAKRNPQMWIGLRDNVWISSQTIPNEDIWSESAPGGDCGSLDVREIQLGVWDGGCHYEDYALCQSL